MFSSKCHSWCLQTYFKSLESLFSFLPSVSCCCCFSFSVREGLSSLSGNISPPRRKRKFRLTEDWIFYNQAYDYFQAQVNRISNRWSQLSIYDMQVHGEELEFIWHDPTIHITACCLQWNAALCRKDSDGDGLTNGQELGDPDCVWTKGQAPQRTTSITHPGMAKERTLLLQKYID